MSLTGFENRKLLMLFLLNPKKQCYGYGWNEIGFEYDEGCFGDLRLIVIFESLG
jgi:hypothetical protein